MDYTVCSREFECDYTWGNAHASHPVAEYARGRFAPAFEGSLTASRFAALLRCPGSPRGVMLCVSVSTPRRDFSHRPIRTMAFLRAETDDEAAWLAAFFAECLRKPDAETLYDGDSPAARAVESIYKVQGVDEFVRFCQSLPSAGGRAALFNGRCAVPRDDAEARRAFAESIPACFDGDGPFLALLTDRSPSSVFDSLGSLFDKGPVRIFSKEISTAEELGLPAQEGGPEKKRRDGEPGGKILAPVVVIGLFVGGGFYLPHVWKSCIGRDPGTSPGYQIESPARDPGVGEGGESVVEPDAEFGRVTVPAQEVQAEPEETMPVPDAVADEGTDAEGEGDVAPCLLEPDGDSVMGQSASDEWPDSAQGRLGP